MRAPLLALSAALLAGPAWAGKTEPGTGAQGARWKNNVVEIVVDPTNDSLSTDTLDIVINAISAWQIATDGLPTLTVKHGKAVPLGYASGKENANSVSFAPKGTDRAKGALAITIITFDLKRGLILDADVLVNGEHHFDAVVGDLQGTVAGEEEHEHAAEETGKRRYDLQNVLTHEFGHFLGLGENYDNESATMYAYSIPGETSKRDLTQEDAIAIATLYQGSVEDIEEEQSAVGCSGASVAQGQGGPFGWLTLSALAGLSAFWIRRRENARAAALVLASLGLWLLTPGSAAPGIADGDHSSVIAVDSHWEGGVIVTRAALQPRGCESCETTTLEVMGGQIGDLKQVVNGLQPLRVGQEVSLKQIERRPRH